MTNDNGNSHDYLSQDEIDALLNQSTGPDPHPAEVKAATVHDYLSELEQDALGEIGNISFGSAATALSTLLKQKVEITTPKVSLVEKANLKKEFPQPHVAVHVNYIDGFQGVNLLVIRTMDAQVIADLMLGGDGTNVSGNVEHLDDIHLSAVQEAMNQMMGSAATSMSTVFNRLVNISPPGIDIFDVINDAGTSDLPDDDVLIKISFRLKIGSLIDSSIMQLLTVSFSREMVEGLIGAPSEASEEPQHIEEPLAELNEQLSSEVKADEVMSEQHEAPEQADVASTMPMSQRNVNVQPVEYAQFEQNAPLTDGEVNLNLLMDIPLKVTVELGRTKKQVREILEFTQGSIIELDKLAGEPVDIHVNDKLIAKGEVVVIDENFGVRVIDIVSQMDRLKNLK